VDCNAVDVRTVERIAAIIGAGPARFVDGAIIGAPPQPGKPGPTFYLSGAPAADLDWLQAFGLRTRRMDGPVGAASALKMSYAGITKGTTALLRRRSIAVLPCGAGHWNSPIVADGRVALPEGNANAHRTSGVLDIWRVRK